MASRRYVKLAPETPSKVRSVADGNRKPTTRSRLPSAVKRTTDQPSRSAVQADDRAIQETAQRPEMRFVPVRTEAQQAVLALHTIRDGLVKAGTAQLHQLQAISYAVGFALP